jgi:hypothetical protein
MNTTHQPETRRTARRSIVHADPELDELHVRAGVDVRLGGRPIRALAAGMVPALVYILIHFFLK